VTYPDTPGFDGSSPEGRATSQAAARAIAAQQKRLRKLTIDLIEAHSPPGLTDEQLDKIAGRRSTLRPRRCELLDLGVVVPSGLHDENDSGMAAVVWTVAWKRVRYIPRQELNGD